MNAEKYAQETQDVVYHRKQILDETAESYDKMLKEDLKCPEEFDVSVFAEYKLEIIKEQITPPSEILEFGCGTGRNMPFIRKYFPLSTIIGCDISEPSLRVAKDFAPFAVFELLQDKTVLEKYTGRIGLIIITNVLHHIPANEHKFWMEELKKLLINDGDIVIFEHNPYNPVIRNIFYTNPKDYMGGGDMVKPAACKKVLKDAGFKIVKHDYTLFFLQRNSITKTVEKMLSWFPLGAQYCVFAKQSGE